MWQNGPKVTIAPYHLTPEWAHFSAFGDATFCVSAFSKLWEAFSGIVGEQEGEKNVWNPQQQLSNSSYGKWQKELFQCWQKNMPSRDTRQRVNLPLNKSILCLVEIQFVSSFLSSFYPENKVCLDIENKKAGKWGENSSIELFSWFIIHQFIRVPLLLPQYTSFSDKTHFAGGEMVVHCYH